MSDDVALCHMCGEYEHDCSCLGGALSAEVVRLRAALAKAEREREETARELGRVTRETFEATRDEIAQMLEDNRDNPEGALNTSQMLIIIRHLTLDTLADIDQPPAPTTNGETE
jgi:hypothetical protein